MNVKTQKRSDLNGPLGITILLCTIFSILITTGCYKESFTTDSGAKVEFSVDTLRFDTVFTELGSATRFFKIYNPNDLAVKVRNINLQNGENSLFRLNVDGFSGTTIDEIQINGNDSAYVFAEVTINPNNPLSVSPFILEEFVRFETNGNIQEVLLEAFGQNANYVPSRFFQNGVGLLTCDMSQITWDDPKPYVIYGTLLIDECELILPPGTRIYVHGGIANNDLGVYNDGVIFTLPTGKITSKGTLTEPVIFQDDRLEDDYIGLWGGIRIGPGSKGHLFENTIIKHGVVGISADSGSTVALKNVQLIESSGFGLFGRHATITAENCLFADNGNAATAFTYGGNYQLDYCTIASFGNDADALVVNNFYCTDPLCLDEIFFNPVEFKLRNSLIVGSSPDEISLSDGIGQDGGFEYLMEDCIVRVDELTDADNHPDFFNFCTPCERYDFSDTLFVDVDMGDYHLDTLSIAEELGKSLLGINTDIEGNQRDPIQPDLGCYEYVK